MKRRKRGQEGKGREGRSKSKVRRGINGGK